LFHLVSFGLGEEVGLTSASKQDAQEPEGQPGTRAKAAPGLISGHIKRDAPDALLSNVVVSHG